MATFDLQAARDAGYTDQEIINYLSENPGFQIGKESRASEFGKTAAKEIGGAGFTLGQAGLGVAGGFAQAATKVADVPFYPVRKGVSFLRKIAGFKEPEIPSLTEQFGTPARQLLEEQIPQQAAENIKEITGFDPRESLAQKGLPFAKAAISVSGGKIPKIPKNLKDIPAFLRTSTVATTRVKAGTEGEPIPSIEEIATGLTIDFATGKIVQQAGKIFRFGVQPEVPGAAGKKLGKIESTAQEAAGKYYGTKGQMRNQTLKEIEKQSQLAGEKLSKIKTEYDPYQFVDGVFRRAQEVGKTQPQIAEAMVQQAQDFINGYQKQLQGGQSLWKLSQTLANELETIFKQGKTEDFMIAGRKQALDEIWKSVGQELRKLGVGEEFKKMSTAYAIKGPVTKALEKQPALAVPLSTTRIPGGVTLTSILAKGAKATGKQATQAILREALKGKGKQALRYVFSPR